MFRKVRKTLGIIFILTAVLLTQIPYERANAAYADFQMSGSTLIKYTGTGENVSIPDTVKIIGDESFANHTELKSIDFGSGVEEIKYSAFNGCTSLETLIIPDQITSIESAAFSNCSRLSNVSIGLGLYQLGNAVFSGCNMLDDIKINDNFVCENGVIYNNDQTTLIEMLPAREANTYTMPSTVTNINSYAFWGCNNLYTLSLSENLKEIPAYSFSNCSGLKTIQIPHSVNKIQMKAFENCILLEAIDIPLSVQFIHETAFDGCTELKASFDEGSYADQYFKDHDISNVTTAEYQDIVNAVLLNAVTEEDIELRKQEEELAQEVSDSEENALTQVTTEDSNNTIPEKNSENVDTGSLLGSTTIVGNEAVVFIDNTNQQVTVGSDLADLTEDDNSSQIEEDYNSNEYIDGISNPQDEKGFSFPKYTIYNNIISNQAYYLSTELKEYKIKDNVTEIGTFAFARTGLESMIIPDSVTKIGYGAFYHCDYLSDISIPETVKEIMPYAFTNTKWLDTWLAYGDTDFLIVGDGILLAYRGSKNNVVIPDDVKNIAPQAFFNHTEISAVDLGSNVISIGEEAFKGCTNLTVIRGGNNLTSIHDRAFENCPVNIIRIQNKVISVGLGAFQCETNVEESILVFQGTELPVITYDEEAQRFSNHDYREDVFQNVEIALISRKISNENITNTVLDPNQPGFHGMVLSVTKEADDSNTGNVSLRLCTLYPGSDGTITIPDTFTIYGLEYRLNSIDDDAFIYYKNNTEWLDCALQAIKLPDSFINQEEALLSNVIYNQNQFIEDYAINVTNATTSLKNSEVIMAIVRGLKENMTLSITESEATAQALKAAYENIYGDTEFSNFIGMDFILTDDNTKVSITKFGQNTITITIPVPISTNAKMIHMLCMDENGQLESVPYQLIMIDDQECILFTASHFSYYGIYEYELTETSESNAGSLDQSPDTGDYIDPKFILELGLLALGIVLILWKDKTRNIKKQNA